jgi:hypothetical protein
MMSSEGDFPQQWVVDRFDGAKWKMFELPQGGHVVVTSRGQELVAMAPEFLKVLREYKQAASKHLENRVRSYLAHGGNSTVYEVGEYKIVVKEQHSGQSLMSSMERMDLLQYIIQKYHLPRWIDLPDHYALIESPHLDHQYLIIQKVDAGLTVADLENFPQIRPEKLALVNKMFPGLNEQAVKQVIEQVTEARKLLEGAIKKAEQEETEINFPNSLLNDWQTSNILVEPLKTPIGGKKFKLTIIDQ